MLARFALNARGTPREGPALPAPRDYTPAAATPADRLAALSARRAFVALKLTFLEAAAALQGEQMQWLREQVRAAEDPVDLWLLRAALFSGLAGADPDRKRLRRRLRRAIEGMYGEPQPTTAFAALR
jgi:hypothetical protein